MPAYDIPEKAIRAFEQAHGLRVTVHDLAGTLWPFLSADRFQHTQPTCQAMKALDGNAACREFDIPRLRRVLADLPEGRFHVCPAGTVEWVVPVFAGGAMAQVVFAGVRSPGAGFPPAGRGSGRPLPVLGAAADPPPPVTAEDADTILEHLRQLAARLRLWAEDARREGVAAPRAGGPGEPAGPLVARRTAVARFLSERHTGRVTLADLARTLGLSESRTSHAVRELYGKTFRDLLAEARLETAAGLLRHSGLPVLEVALRSGFDDPSHFHRLFRRRMGATPLRYRRDRSGP
jgi:AraC-like DNA-binding protein